MRTSACRHVLLTLALVLLPVGLSFAAGQPETAVSPDRETQRTISFTIVYDNNPYDDRVEPGNGFACLIEGLDKTILFDTGGDGERLLENMEKLGIDPATVDVIFISHNHADHVGGLEAFLAQNPRVTVYLPQRGLTDLLAVVQRTPARAVAIAGGRIICPGAYSTGPAGDWLKEQALVVETPRGPVLVTGCAHSFVNRRPSLPTAGLPRPGIWLTARRAKDLAKRNLHLVVGGYHLHENSAQEVEEIAQGLKDDGVEFVAPTHCTPDSAKVVLQRTFGDRCLRVGVGWKMVIGPEERDAAGPEGTRSGAEE
jgi:7,8-dihydropterin-6-yl-methyl-4-(beta-D-ribofuranosyl)aminobenzene 5'-phosphate synthase